MIQLSSKHVIGIEHLTVDDIELILKTATQFKEIINRPIKKVPTLQGKTVVNLFYESSTRTRISFELAEKRLSADSVNFAVTGSSVSKGETLKDTVRNIEAMKVGQRRNSNVKMVPRASDLEIIVRAGKIDDVGMVREEVTELKVV